MGVLVEGQWQQKKYDTEDGSFKRDAAVFRNWVSADGRAGVTGNAGYKAESGRYHLFVSLACPWAHRTLIFRQLKDLTAHIGVTVVGPDMLAHGWELGELGLDYASALDTADSPLPKAEFLHQVYSHARADYSGRVTVPVLWDKATQTIVSNESADIIRMFNSAFNEITHNLDDYYPEALHSDIDAMNASIYEHVNNGVYKAGFATTQAAYEKAFVALFNELDALDARLSNQRFLLGNVMTEADWRLFTTLIRFDAVYVGHFKCNLKRIEDYPHLAAYVRDLYQQPGIAETVDFAHIKRHYYFSHENINPNQFVPCGPWLDYSSAHHRDELFI